MITLATCFTVTRLAVRIVKRYFWNIEDVIMMLAWAFSTAMSIGYIIITPAVYRIAAVGEGERPPYPGIKEDSEFLVKMFFPNVFLFWSTLWLVKVALLLLCRQLIDRRHKYILVWRWILGITVVFYLGCLVTEFTSCRNMHDWFSYGLQPLSTQQAHFTDFSPGMCQTKRDARASVISLFYAFAVDVATDLMSAYLRPVNLRRLLRLTGI